MLQRKDDLVDLLIVWDQLIIINITFNLNVLVRLWRSQIDIVLFLLLFDIIIKQLRSSQIILVNLSESIVVTRGYDVDLLLN